MAFALRSDASTLSDMNITPLVDVLLVMLVIFMLAAPVVSRPLMLEVPQQGPTPPVAPEVLQLTLDGQGRWLWQGQPLPATTVVGLLQVEAGRDPQPVLQLSADPEAGYAHWVQMLAASRQAGFEHVALPRD
jgi:biopolymer transport protein ExbD